MSAEEIHRELYAVYGQNIMIEGTLRQLCRMFEDGLTNIHDEERSVGGVFFRVLTKISERWRYNFNNFCVNFYKLHALFYTR
jgi:hypothetical protein